MPSLARNSCTRGVRMEFIMMGSKIGINEGNFEKEYLRKGTTITNRII